MFKNALVSVSDKTGLIDFLRPLAAQGLRIVSTGGTARHLKENGFKIVEVSEQTGFPEVMDGRVKTLHPKVHMALLARLDNSEDRKLLAQENIQAFDLVIGNLYPFAAASLKFQKNQMSWPELVENIDIGGPSFLRAAAKNYPSVAVICDVQDYAWVASREVLSLQDRQRLAGKVFAHASAYDSMVAQELGVNWRGDFAIGGHAVQDLRYGENPHQQASWFSFGNDDRGMQTAKILQGKPLSYNNLLDLDAAAHLVRNLHLFLKAPAAVVVKHNNPCGAAVDQILSNAMVKALAADPVSAFGGVVAASVEVDKQTAEKLSELFLECIVAPSFTEDALQTFAKKKNLRLLAWPKMLEKQNTNEFRSLAGGFLIQEVDSQFGQIENWKLDGKSPPKELISDLLFAEILCASLKSNAICIVKDGKSLGLGMGQVNRVEAVQHAVDRMHLHHGKIEGTVMASDAFFPFADSVEKAAANGVKWILQPGGSVRDEEVLQAATQLDVKMVLSGVRHFRH